MDDAPFMDEELLKKQEAFELLDYINSTADDSDALENSQQAALNMDLPLQPPPKRRGKRDRPYQDRRSPSRSRSSPVLEPGNLVHSTKGALVRRNTEPLQSTSAAKAKAPEVIVIEDSLSSLEGQHNQSPTPESRHVPDSHIAVPRRVTGEKRKRENQIPLLPQEQLIFSGCNIFFFPNNDINMARRIRMVKAVERGAVWVKKWHFSATHIVVDQDYKFEDVKAHLQLPTLPLGVTLVNDSFTTDCVRFRMIVDSTQPQYLVKGAPTSQYDPAPTHQHRSGEPMADKSEQVETSRLRRPKQIHAAPKRSVSVESNDEIEHRLGGQDHLKIQYKYNTDSSQGQEPAEQAHQSKQGSASREDGLEQAIAEARSTAHLPLDADEDSDTIESRAGSTNGLEVPAWQKNFMCMQDPSSRPSSSGPNAHTIDLLQQLGSYYDSIHDQWRSRAYRIAVSQLKKSPHEITASEEAMKLPGVGRRIAEKMEEIYRTSRLQRLENALLEPEDKALRTFLGVYGVGFVQAQSWVRNGLRTLADLANNDVHLTRNQRIGIEHYDDFNTRISRDEVTKLGDVVIQALKRIDAGFRITIGGSYRRDAETSGDIDILISHPANSLGYTRRIVLETLVPRLEKQGFLVASLAVTSRDDGTKWHGACVLPPTVSSALEEASDIRRRWRRIDLLLVPNDEIGAALLYFTGNDIFNRSMRLLARKKGMRLNQRGLYKDVARGRSGEKLNKGTKIAGGSEADIFKELGVPWRDCTERDC